MAMSPFTPGFVANGYRLLRTSARHCWYDYRGQEARVLRLSWLRYCYSSGALVPARAATLAPLQQARGGAAGKRQGLGTGTPSRGTGGEG